MERKIIVVSHNLYLHGVAVQARSIYQLYFILRHSSTLSRNWYPASYL